MRICRDLSPDLYVFWDNNWDFLDSNWNNNWDNSWDARVIL